MTHLSYGIPRAFQNDAGDVNMTCKSAHNILISQKPLHIFSRKFTFSLNIINVYEHTQKDLHQPVHSGFSE